MSVFSDMGGAAMRDLAAGIIAATPEAQIAAAEAAETISADMALAMRDSLRAEEEIASLVKRIGDAAMSALEEQHSRIVEAAEAWRDEVVESIRDMWSAIDDPRSIAAAEEALDDQQRTVAEAEADLAEARRVAKGGKADTTEEDAALAAARKASAEISSKLEAARAEQARAIAMGADGAAYEAGQRIAELESELEKSRQAEADAQEARAEAQAEWAERVAEARASIPDLEERLSDAKTAEEEDALRLIKRLLEAGTGVTNGKNGTVDMIALGKIAGLSEQELFDLGYKYTALLNAERSAASAAAGMPSTKQFADAIAQALKEIGAGMNVNMTMLTPTPEVMAAIKKLLEDWWKNRGLGA